MQHILVILMLLAFAVPGYLSMKQNRTSRSAINISIFPGSNHNMTWKSEDLLEGQTAEFNCTIQISSDAPGSYTWYHNGFIIRGGPFSDVGQRVQVEQSHKGTLYQSRLRIKALVWRNSGNIACYFRTGIGYYSIMIGRLNVLAIPYYDMNPYTLTVYAGESIKLTCNAYVPDTGHPDIPKGVSFTWQKNNKVLVNGTGVKISNMDYISTLEETAVTSYGKYRYQCIVLNAAGRGEKHYAAPVNDIEVDVITSHSTICNQTHYIVDWPMTTERLLARVPCYDNYTGHLSYSCGKDGNWKDLGNFCWKNSILQNIAYEIVEVSDGIAADPKRTNMLARDLRDAEGTILIESMYEPSRTLKQALNTLKDLSLVHSLLEEPPLDSELESFVQTTSSLTDVKYINAWSPSLVKDLYLDCIVESLDRYCHAVYKGFYNSSDTWEIATKNLDVSLFQWTKSSSSITYRDDDTGDTVIIPSETLLQVLEDNNLGQIMLWILNYKTADMIKVEKVQSSVLSFGIANISYGYELKSPVKIIFSRKQNPSDNMKKERCSVWQDRNVWSTSVCDTMKITDTEITCECYQTGRYGILLTSDPTIWVHLSINPSNISEGDTSILKCTVQMEPPSAVGTFTWTLNRLLLTNGERVSLDRKYDSAAKKLISQLNLTEASLKDAGVAKCTFKYLDLAPQHDDARLEVNAKPRVKIDPLRLTTSEGSNITISCSASLPGRKDPDDSTFHWYQQNGETAKDISNSPSNDETVVSSGGQMSNLIVKAGTIGIVHYGCTATNRGATSERVMSIITVVKKDTPSCDPEIVDGVTWPEIAEGTIAVGTCPGNTTGQVYRECIFGEKWKDANFDHCIDDIYVEILDEVLDIASGIGAITNKTLNVSKTLEETIEAEMNKSEAQNQTIRTGNLNASLEAVDQLSKVHEKYQEPPSSEEVMSIIQISSALIDSRNHIAWAPILQKNLKHATTMMQAIDRYSDVFGKSVNNTDGFETANIVFSVEPWQRGNKGIIYPLHLNNSKGKWVQNTTDRIILSDDTLTQITEELNQDILIVSSTYYKSLEPLLPGSAKSKQKLGSKVLSVRIANVTQNVMFDKPLLLTFETNLESANDDVICSYWNFSYENGGRWDQSGCETHTSNTSVTYCECTHMTNFAILVSHYKPSSRVQRALSIITYIGCTLSILGMILMIAIHMIVWKEIKFVVRGNVGRHVTLMNLCLVLIAANLLFLLGMEKTKPKGSCTAITAILQYLFLVAFALMTVLSVTLYWKVSSFTRGMQTDKTRNTVINMVLAWVIPSVIVAISLGVTQTKGYGNEHYCWLSTENGLIWSFIGPIALVLFVNFAILVLVLRVKLMSHGFKGTSKDAGLQKMRQPEILKSTFWSLVVLVPVMGTNWIFGLVAVNKETVAFEFIFAILNSFQGFFLFIFHCVADASVRKAWRMKFGPTPLERLGKIMRENKVKRKQSEATTSLDNLDTGHVDTGHSNLKKADGKSTIEDTAFIEPSDQ